MADDLQTFSTPPASAVSARPLLDRWLFEQRISMAEFARAIGVSREAVRLWCLAFDNAQRWKPSPANRARIEDYTANAVPGWTFDDTPEARAAFFAGAVIAPAVPAGVLP